MNKPVISPQEKMTNELVSLIGQFENQIRMALPKHLTPSRMTRILITEVRKNPKLALCDRQSFFGAVITCAQLGLEPGMALGNVYLIPYKSEVQVILGYQGMLELIERDGRITVEAHVVYEKDVFEYTLGLEATMKHVPYFGKESPGEVIASYAIARYKDGRYKFRVCPLHEIEKARSASSNSNSIPWKQHYPEMAKKTAIRRLFKVVPKNPEIAHAVEVDERREILDTQNLANVYLDYKKDNNIQDADFVIAPTDVKKEELFSMINEEMYKRVTETLQKLKVPDADIFGLVEGMEGKDIQTELKRISETYLVRG